MRRYAGFTLLELMVTVAIIAITIAVAAPSFTQMTNRSRLVSASNELLAALQQSRMEAVRTNSSVDICPTTDGATCTGSDWHRFIIISKKSDIGVVREIRLPTQLVLVESPELTSSHKVSFSPGGFAKVGMGAQGGLYVCASQLTGGAKARYVKVSTAIINAETYTAAVTGCS